MAPPKPDLLHHGRAYPAGIGTLLVAAAWALFFLAGAALADEAAVKKAIQARFPNETVQSVTKTPYLGLYEVVVGGQLLYADEKLNYIFVGSIIDAKTLNNLTEERARKLFAIKIDSLPLDLAIKNVKGNGKRKVVIFSDPNCPYCKRLERELVNVTDVTIYTLLYPILPGSEEKARAIWCSADRVKAWDDLMLRDIAPPPGKCETPIPTLLQLGRNLRVTGTPTLVFADGRVVPGMLPVAQLESHLNAANK